MVPNKTEAVKYLDTESVPPARYARVIVNHGASDQAGIDEYMVGPLPASKITTIAPLSWTYSKFHHLIFLSCCKKSGRMTPDFLGFHYIL